jgi:hypothetical protein
VPEVIEGLGDAAVREGVAVAVDAEVPLDAGVEGGEGEVAAADEGDAEGGGLEAPALGVEGAGAAWEGRGLDDAGLEGASRAVVVGFVFVETCGALPVDEEVDGVGLGDLEVVAGDEADVRAAGDRAVEVGADAVEAGGLDEGGDDRDGVGLGEEWEDVAGEGVGLAAGGEGGVLSEVVAAAGDDVADAAAGVVHVVVVAGDDVDVEVGDGLAGGGAGVEADVVAVGVELGVEGEFDLVDEGEDG